MVYAAPPPAQAATTVTLVDPAPALTHAKPQHRRTRSYTFTDDRTSTSFTPTAAPALPRRKSTKKAFYLEEDGNSSPEPTEESILSPLLINTDVPNFPTFSSTNQPVPFPRSEGPLSPDVRSPRPSFSRTPSSSGVVVNGKPLKPSLKSASAPHLPDELRAHFRARSEPSTPSAKSVHFREEDDLEEVRVYNRAGRPANLLNKPAEETETETEAEGAFPFPRTHAASPVSPSGVPPPSPTLAFEIDFAPAQTSIVPRPNPDMYANVFLESLSLPKTRPAALRGSVLVRNVAFEKNIALRFTFDDWQTTSEVFCKHVVSLPGLPPPFPRPHTVGDAVGMLSTGPAIGWDRFSFQISLEDYATKLAERTLYLVARYTSPNVGEWWDNNGGQNYRVRFKHSATPPPTMERSSASLVVQQQGFGMPSTMRLTPHSSGMPAAAASPASSPALRQPKPTPAQVYAASITKGRPVYGSPVPSPRESPRGSPRGSPTTGASPHTSPSESPVGSDNEVAARNKRSTRSKPNMGLGLGLGLGLNPHAHDSPVKSTPLPVRPPTMTRSNSSPPVYSPSSQADSIGSFLASADMARPSPLASREHVDPFMAKLSKLSLRNYAAPGRSRASSVDENDKPGAHTTSTGHEITVQQATPPAVEHEEEDITQQHQDGSTGSSPNSDSHMHMNAPASSPVTSSNDHSPMDGGSAASSANSSATNSPLPGTPSMLSLSELPGFDWNAGSASSGKHTPTSENGSAQSGSESDTSKGSASTIQQRRISMPRTTDIVLNMPSPTSRGAINSPFSPISTPRFHIGQPGNSQMGMFSPEQASDFLSPTRSRVGDADYAAFVRQWCFARSPSPGGTPVGEGVPVAAGPPPPVQVLSGPLQPAVSTPPVAMPKVALGDGYGFNMGLGSSVEMQAGKA